MTVEALVLQVGEGRSVSLRGTRIAYEAAGVRPAGGPTVLEFSVAPGFNTGDHVHRTIEELSCVIEGRVQIRVDERLLQAQAGDFVPVPPFGSLEGAPAKLLLIISPAGVPERYFEELAEILATPGAPDVQAIGQLRARYDTTRVSPLSA